MIAEMQDLLSLHVDVCEEDATRYRWVIREDCQTVRWALYSLPDEAAALAQGREALREVAALFRDAEAAGSVGDRWPAARDVSPGVASSP